MSLFGFWSLHCTPCLHRMIQNLARRNLTTPPSTRQASRSGALPCGLLELWRVVERHPWGRNVCGRIIVRLANLHPRPSV
eukprot:3119410-Amphidinium_carterae.2